MAQITDHGYESAGEMVEGGKLHQGKEHSGGDKGSHKRRNVTAEEIDIFRQLYEQGFTGKQIAYLTGRSKTAVYRHLQLKEAKRPRWTDDEMQVLVDGYLELQRGEIGKTLSEKLGRSRRSVYVQMHNYRKKLKRDPKKTRALRAITMAFRAVRKADIFRESEYRKEFGL